MVADGLAIVAFWKTQMEAAYADTPFDICLSVDTGDTDVPPSVTLRFWAVRNGAHFLEPSLQALCELSQPILMEQVSPD